MLRDGELGSKQEIAAKLPADELWTERRSLHACWRLSYENFKVACG